MEDYQNALKVFGFDDSKIRIVDFVTLFRRTLAGYRVGKERQYEQNARRGL